MLLQNPELVQVLLDALFLDPNHPRAGMDKALKAAIQRDAGESFLQLSLFGPGRELLLQHPEALVALRALRGSALTERAKVLAANALIALEGPAAIEEKITRRIDDKHVMVSCARQLFFLCLSLRFHGADCLFLAFRSLVR